MFGTKLLLLPPNSKRDRPFYCRYTSLNVWHSLVMQDIASQATGDACKETIQGSNCVLVHPHLVNLSHHQKVHLISCSTPFTAAHSFNLFLPDLVNMRSSLRECTMMAGGGGSWEFWWSHAGNNLDTSFSQEGGEMPLKAFFPPCCSVSWNISHENVSLFSDFLYYS